MNSSGFQPKLVLATVSLAAVFWFVTFFIPYGIFWIKISISASVLALLAFFLDKGRPRITRPRLVDLPIGIGSAALLYGIFWLGKAISTLLFPFAERQIGAVYGIGEGVPMSVIVMLLFFVTGPAEEIYWRGFLQRKLAGRFGSWRGWLLATAIYSGVHISSLNFMLIGAAAVAGAFWGLMYWRIGRLWPVIISHAIWSTVVFAFLPIP